MAEKETPTDHDRLDESPHQDNDSETPCRLTGDSFPYSRRKLLHGVAATSIGLVAGCSGSDGTPGSDGTSTESPPNSDETPTESPTSESKTTFRMVSPWGTGSLDPMQGSTQLLRLSVFEPLIAIDYDAKLAPGLAKSWSVSDDNTTWSFQLREDVTFHSGTAFDAAAAAFSLRRAFGSGGDEGAGTALSMLPVESVEIADTSRVTVTTEVPFAPLPAHLTRRFAVMMDPDSVTEDGEVPEPVGTGPFEFESWEGGQGTTVLTAFDNYYGDSPALDRVEYKNVQDAQTRELALRNGETEMARQLTPEAISRVEGTETANIVTYQPPRLRFFAFNTTAAPVDDVRVRQAFNYGIDEPAIIDSVLQGVETPAVGPWAPSVPARWRNEDLEPYDYQPDRAASLLEEAGWTMNDGTRSRDGEPLAVTLWTYTSRAAQPLIAQAVQSQLGEIGFDIEVRATGYGAMDDAHAAGDAHVTLENWSMYGWPPDPDRLTFYYHSSASMAPGYANDRVDEILKTGRRTTDSAKRERLYNELQSIVQEELPLGYFSYPASIVGVNAAVESYRPHPTQYKWGLGAISM